MWLYKDPVFYLFLYISSRCIDISINSFLFWLQHNGGYESQPKNVNNIGRSKQHVSKYFVSNNYYLFNAQIFKHI